MNLIVSHLLKQIEAAKSEISEVESKLELPIQSTSLFETHNFNSFYDRCKSTAVNFVKSLEGFEDLLDGFLFNRLLDRLPSLDATLAKDTKQYVKDNLSSTEVSKYLCEIFAETSDAFVNHSESSDYPDLIRTDFDYSFLSSSREPGSPGIRGKRPTNVPDGVEIKTSKNSSINLDCHGPKMGCFAYCMWKFDEKVLLQDVYVAFLKKSDFKEGKRISKQTTPKWNVKDLSAFISVKNKTPYGTSKRNEEIIENYALFDYQQPDLLSL